MGRKEGAFGENRGTGQSMLKAANDTRAEATLMLTGKGRRKQLPRIVPAWEVVPRGTTTGRHAGYHPWEGDRAQ